MDNALWIFFVFVFAYVKEMVTLDCLTAKSMDFRWAYLNMSLTGFLSTLTEPMSHCPSLELMNQFIFHTVSGWQSLLLTRRSGYLRNV